ncbi:mannosyl transferase [Hypoxylon fragiforme]|uniref:mannosyl transferase n=1 Tax=Hypoxylon fragiforme TaxID=63214 RepID=UPI0020C6F74D|nr:mannosyl transferase [Hypoxylon fragiforme]KAI2609457.1 mannosyl transferase [Hypoxylon fragiforme]
MADSETLLWARSQVVKHVGQAYEGLQESGRGCASAVKTYWGKYSFQTHQRESIYTAAGAVLLVSTIIMYLVRRRNLRKTSMRPSTPTAPALEKAALRDGSAPKTQGREWGKWIPSDFCTPKPDPYPDWSVENTKPLPYRPFRYGPKYNVTMGLRSIKHTDWIELDNHYPRYHADKAQRIQERGSKCCRTAPEAFPAAVELLEELADYLPSRYPSMYKRTDVGIDNLWSGESFDIVTRPLPEDPMQTCARLVQDDLAIMIEKEDSQYYLLAGAVLLAGFWRLEDKYQMPLSEIHTSGSVPQYKEKLEKGMMNFFRRLKPEEMVARNNYFFQVDDALPWSWSIGSEDAEEVSWGTAEKDRAVSHHYFRSERQSLRRLPKSGGVVFTIRTYFHPVTEIAEEDYVPGRLASAIRSWGDDVSRYKGKEKYGDVLLEYLDKKHKEQVDRGLDLSREEEVRAYPY